MTWVRPIVRTTTRVLSKRTQSTCHRALFSTSRSTQPPPHLDTLSHDDTFHSHDPTHQETVNNLLYNMPPPSQSQVRRRTLCALVSNESGVLSRVSGVLAGRGVNIDSLVVSETETPGLSRMTIIMKGESSDVVQVRKQLEDLVQIWAVVEFDPHAPVVERELLLVKLAIVPPTATGRGYPRDASTAIDSHIQRQAIVELSNLFQGRVLDLTPDFILIEMTGKSAKIDAFVELVRPFGIKELARSGALAMLRGAITSVHSKGKQGQERKSQSVDVSQLPPG